MSTAVVLSPFFISRWIVVAKRRFASIFKAIDNAIAIHPDFLQVQAAKSGFVLSCDGDSSNALLPSGWCHPSRGVNHKERYRRIIKALSLGMDEVIEWIILQMTVYEDRLADEFRDRRQVSFPFEYLVVAADLDGDRSERHIVAASEIDRLDNGPVL